MTGEGWLAVGALMVAGISVGGNIWMFYLQKGENKKRDEAQIKRDEAHTVNLICEVAKDEKDPEKAEKLIEEAFERHKAVERKVKKE